MELSSQLPPPTIFNGLKHHRLIILEFIKKSIEKDYPIDTLNLAMKKIGNSMIDLYHGDLKPQDISDEIVDLLKLESNFFKDAYYKYVNSIPKKYRIVKISDGSEWALLLGREEEFYLHIHPARGSKFTTRVRAISIKTAILLKIFFEKELVSGDLVSLMNKVRINYLHESPVKNEADTKSLKRVLELL